MIKFQFYIIKFPKFKIEVAVFLLSFLSLLFSFVLNEDGAGGRARGDFEATFGFVFALQENLLANPAI